MIVFYCNARENKSSNGEVVEIVHPHSYRSLVSFLERLQDPNVCIVQFNLINTRNFQNCVNVDRRILQKALHLLNCIAKLCRQKSVDVR